MNDDWLSRANNEYYNEVLANKAGRVPKNYVEQLREMEQAQPEPGFLESLLQGGVAQGAGVLQGQAEFLNTLGIGDGATANYLNEVMQNNARKRDYTWQDMVDDPWKYITDPQGMVYDLGGGLGSSAVLLGETALTGGVGGAAARAAGLAGKYGTTARMIAGIDMAAKARNMPWVSNILRSPAGKMLVLNVMKTPLEAASEGGNVARDIRESGDSEDEQLSGMLKSTALNTVLLSFTNTLESAGLGKLIAKEGGKDELVKKLTGIVDDASKLSVQGDTIAAKIGNNITSKMRQLPNVGKYAAGFAGNALQNAYEEGAQETISQYSKGENEDITNIVNPLAWNDEALTSSIIGGVAGAGQGAVMTGVGKGINKYLGKPKTEASNKPKPVTSTEEEAETKQLSGGNVLALPEGKQPALPKQDTSMYDNNFSDVVGSRETLQKVLEFERNYGQALDKENNPEQYFEQLGRWLNVSPAEAKAVDDRVSYLKQTNARPGNLQPNSFSERTTQLADERAENVQKNKVRTSLVDTLNKGLNEKVANREKLLNILKNKVAQDNAPASIQDIVNRVKQNRLNAQRSVYQHQDNTGKAQSVAQYQRVQKALNDEKLVDLMRKGLAGDKNAAKLFKTMSPEVRNALLARETDRLLQENRRVANEQFKAREPFLPEEFYAGKKPAENTKYTKPMSKGDKDITNPFLPDAAYQQLNDIVTRAINGDSDAVDVLVDMQVPPEYIQAIADQMLASQPAQPTATQEPEPQASDEKVVEKPTEETPVQKPAEEPTAEEPPAEEPQQPVSAPKPTTKPEPKETPKPTEKPKPVEKPKPTESTKPQPQPAEEKPADDEQPTGEGSKPSDTTGDKTGGKGFDQKSNKEPEEERRKKKEEQASQSAEAVARRVVIKALEKAGIKVHEDLQELKEEIEKQGYKVIQDFDTKNFIVQRGSSRGELYGFINPQTGDMYLDPNVSLNTPIHEFTHLWNSIVKVTNPELWRKGVELAKQSPIWNEIRNSPFYGFTDENDLADEVIARLVGPRGEKMLNEMAIGETDKSLFAKLKNWIKDFWYSLKNTFANWGSKEAQELTLDEFIQMPLADLFKGTNLMELKKLYPTRKAVVDGRTIIKPYDVKDTGLTMEEAKKQAAENQAASKKRKQQEEQAETGAIKGVKASSQNKSGSALAGALGFGKKNEGKTKGGSASSTKPTTSKPSGTSTTKPKPSKPSAKKTETRFAGNDADDMATLGDLFKAFVNPANSNIKFNVQEKYNTKAITVAFKIGGRKFDEGKVEFDDWANDVADVLRANPAAYQYLKPWLGAIYKAIQAFPENTEFNEVAMSAALDFTIASYQKGNLTYGEIYDDLAEMYGDEVAEAAAPYIESSFVATQEYNVPTLQYKGDKRNDSDRTTTNTEDDNRGGETQDQDRESDDGRKPDAGDGEGDSQTSEAGGSRTGGTDNDGSGSAVGGEQTVLPGESETPDTGTTAPRGADSEGSSSNGTRGESASDRERPQTVEQTPDNAPVDETIELDEEEKAIADKVEKKMSFLTVLQKGNVIAAIKRMYNRKLQAMLLTDGTGTGKTFSGLALAKSALDDGKKRILVLVPSQSIARQWQQAASAKGFFNIENVAILKNRKDGGDPFTETKEVDGKQTEVEKKNQAGIYITTYDNFAENDAVIEKGFDLILCDEAHNLMMSAVATETANLNKLRALTYHPRGLEERADVLYSTPEEKTAKKRFMKIAAAHDRVINNIKRWTTAHEKSAKYPIPQPLEEYVWVEEANTAMPLNDYIFINDNGKSEVKQQGILSWVNERVNSNKMTKTEGNQLVKKYTNALQSGGATLKDEYYSAKVTYDTLAAETAPIKQENIAKWQAMEDAEKPKVLFLSATPWAYDVNVDWAEGYLFKYPPSETTLGGGITGRQAFMKNTFGYTIKNGKLVKPGDDVDTSENEIAFHEDLRSSGALRGETLSVPYDYNRGFLVVKDDSMGEEVAIGEKIDNGFNALAQEKYAELFACLKSEFNNEVRSDLLESLKASAAVKLAREYVKLGHKVIITHRRKKDKQIKNPFALPKTFSNSYTSDEPRQKEEIIKRIKTQYAQFQKEYPEYANLDLKNLKTALSALQDEEYGFKKGEAVYVNGDITSNAERARAIDLFNTDGSGYDIFVGQVDAIGEGVNLQDTTGKQPRVLINIAIPQKPSEFSQIEGRIYRYGTSSNSIFRYLSTGTNFENDAWTNIVAGRVETAENLAMGKKARGMLNAIRTAFLETVGGSEAWKSHLPGVEGADRGGKAIDYRRAESGYESTLKDYEDSKTFTANGLNKNYNPVPEPLGYRMVEWAKIKNGEKILDPFAGHGAISRYFSRKTKNIILETNPQLASVAKFFTPDVKFVEGDFANYNTIVKFDAITMTPPFTEDGIAGIKNVFKAFEHLRDGGRIVAVVQDNTDVDAALNKWLESENGKTAYVTNEISLPASVFERVPNAPKTKVIVIDKHNSTKRIEAPAKKLSFGKDLTIDEFFNKLSDFTTDRISDRIPVDDKTRKAIIKQKEYLEKLAQDFQENQDVIDEVVGGDVNKVAKRLNDVIDAILNLSLENPYVGKTKKDIVARMIRSVDNKGLGTLYYNEKGRMGYKLIDDNRFEVDEKQLFLLNNLKDFLRDLTKEFLIQKNVNDLKAKFNAALDKAKEKAVAKGEEVDSYSSVKTNKDGTYTISPLVDNLTEKDVANFKNSFYSNHFTIDGHKLIAETSDDAFYAKNVMNDFVRSRQWKINRDIATEKAKAEIEKRYKAEKTSDTGTSYSIEEQQSAERSYEELYSEVKKALPNAKLSNDGNYITAEMPNGAKIAINIQDEIIVNEKEQESARAAHGFTDKTKPITIEGYWQKIIADDVNGMIALSKNSRKGTAFHEVMHAVMDLALTSKEKNALIGYYKKAAKASKKSLDEAIADGYTDWLLQREQNKGSLFGKLYNKMLDMLYKLQKIFTGIENAHEVMRKIETGEVWTNNMMDASDETIRYSAAEVTEGSKIADAFKNSRPEKLTEKFKNGNWKAWLKDMFDKLYIDWVDKNLPLKAVDEIYSNALGRKLLDSESIYERATATNYNSAGIARALIEGDEDYIKAINKMMGKKKLPWKVTMKTVLDKVQKKDMDSKHPDYLKENGFEGWGEAFSTYLGTRRLREMYNLNKQDYRDKLRAWAANGYKGAKPQYQEYLLPNNLTIGELNQYIDKAPKEFAEAAELYYKLNDNLLTLLEDAGLISEQLHTMLKTKYKEYCPLMRDFSDTAAADTFIGGMTMGGRGIGNVQNPLHKIISTGSERNIISPLESTINAISVFANRCERNKVGIMAVNLAENAGIPELALEMPQGTNVSAKDCTFTVMIDGRKHIYQTTPYLYGPIAGYNVPAASMVFKVASGAAHLLRVGATMSPSFVLRNVIRDTIFAGVSSKNGFIPIYDTIRGAYALYKRPSIVAKFKSAGVDAFNFYGTGENRYKAIDELVGENFNKTNPVHWVKAIKGLFQMLSENTEAATRMGEFIRAMEKGKDIYAAAKDARNVTLNFGRSGVKGEQFNKIVPFFNACIQGGDKMVRMFKDYPIETAVRTFTYIVLPSIVLWGLNHDEDWYEKVDPAIKNQNWIIPTLGDTYIRIPKPQEIGVLFGSGMEAMLDQAYDKDPAAVKNWWKQFSGNVMPNFIPTVLLPMIEWEANYSFFRGQKIVSSRLERLPDEKQFINTTTEVSKAIGSALKLSPVKIDNTIRNLTGTMGMLLLQSPDPLIESQLSKPARKFNERTFIRDFNLTDSNLNRYINDFYEIYTKSEKEHSGYGKKGSPSKATQSIRSAYKLISGLNKDIQTITDSPKLSPVEKRIRIDRKRAQIEKIATKVVKKYREHYL